MDPRWQFELLPLGEDGNDVLVYKDGELVRKKDIKGVLI